MLTPESAEWLRRRTAFLWFSIDGQILVLAPGDLDGPADGSKDAPGLVAACGKTVEEAIRNAESGATAFTSYRTVAPKGGFLQVVADSYEALSRRARSGT